MGKIRTKAQEPPASSPEAIIVENPSQVVTPCLRLLKTLLGDNRMAFEETPIANNEVKFGLSGSPIQGIARDKYALFLLLSVNAELFWLGATLAFKRELGRYRLISVSLIVFKGDGLDDRKTPLLRAEWDDIAGGTTSIHGQPHWHVYPRFISRNSDQNELDDLVSVQSLDAPIEETIANGDDFAWPTSAHFHYAMATTWQTERNAYQEKLTELVSLIGWLKGCITYSRNQLEFLSS